MEELKKEQPVSSALESEFPPIVKIDVTEEIIGRIKALLAKGRLKPAASYHPKGNLHEYLASGGMTIRKRATSCRGLKPEETFHRRHCNFHVAGEKANRRRSTLRGWSHLS